MKRRFFSTVLFVVLCLYALNLKGDVSWQNDPLITSFPLEFNKYIDIVSEEASWYYPWIGGTGSVTVSAELNGVGEGVATLKNVYLMGKPTLTTYGGEPTRFGTMNPDGSWKNATASVSVSREESIPDEAVDGDSWSWGAGGLSEITPTPWGWRETRSQGWTISIPAGVQGRFTSTGGWAAGAAQPERTASGKSGTHTLKVQYKCSKCNKFGDSAAALGGKAAHEKITCPAPNCSVQYHKCSPPSNHAVCDGCGKRKCEPGDHSYVGRCNGEYVHYTQWVAGCGEDIYRCTRSQHQAQTYSCGHTMKACQYASHTCVTDDTPNCSDCTSHCSSPCSCSTSGTCNGTVTDNTPNCSDCTSHCSSPCSCSTSGTCNGTVVDNTPNCSDCTSHCSSPCSCTNSGTCNGTVATPPPPSGGSTPPSGGTTCDAGHPYNPDSSSAVNRHRTRTCRFSECRQTWQACVNGWTPPICNKPYRNRNGLTCWAE